LRALHLPDGQAMAWARLWRQGRAMFPRGRPTRPRPMAMPHRAAILRNTAVIPRLLGLITARQPHTPLPPITRAVLEAVVTTRAVLAAGVAGTRPGAVAEATNRLKLDSRPSVPQTTS
jgi:hypothetical protein